MRPIVRAACLILGLVVVVDALGCRSDTVAPPTASQPTPSAPSGTTSQPASHPVRIMPVGDSITQADSDHNSYRRVLWKSLESEGYLVDFVGSLRGHHRGPPPRNDFDRDHEGHWGWRTDEILERIRGWVQATEPDVLLIHLGSNDVFQGEPVARIIGELGELIDAVRESRPEATFLLAQIIPTRMAGANRGINELNRRIPDLAGAKSTAASPVIVVDHFTGFDAEQQTYDGVHPNEDGEIHMSDRWLAALEELLEQ